MFGKLIWFTEKFVWGQDRPLCKCVLAISICFEYFNVCPQANIGSLPSNFQKGKIPKQYSVSFLWKQTTTTVYRTTVNILRHLTFINCLKTEVEVLAPLKLSAALCIFTGAKIKIWTAWQIWLHFWCSMFAEQSMN